MFALTEAYYLRGSAREAEYFARQAVELSEQLNIPAVNARALARRGEVQLHMNKLEDACASISRAVELVYDCPGIDAAVVRRLKAEYSARTSEERPEQGGAAAFEEIVAMLEELDASFRQFDSFAFG
jgi:separase